MIYNATQSNELKELSDLLSINFGTILSIADINLDAIKIKNFNGNVEFEPVFYSNGIDITEFKNSEHVHILKMRPNSSKKLAYFDNWYNLTFYLNDDKDNVAHNIKKVKINDKAYNVKRITEGGTYNDHGHEYSYSTNNYVLEYDTELGILTTSITDLIDKGFEVYLLE